MSLKIRLRRMGNKNRPFYRIVVTDNRERRDGRFLEMIGYYDSLPEPHKFSVDEGSLFRWMEKGAQLSETVRSLLKREGVLARYKGSAKSAPAGSEGTSPSPEASAPPSSESTPGA